MSVGAICTRTVDTAKADESVQLAAERMHQRTVGSLVVVGKQQEVLGIVTDRDLVVRVLASGRDPHTTTIGQAMTANPETIVEDAPIDVALGRMHRGRFRRLPVVNQRGTLVGIVSLDDILMRIGSEQNKIGQLIRNETPDAVSAH